MLKVVIVVDGSAADRPCIELAGRLLAGKEAEITLLHVVTLPCDKDQEGVHTVVLEGFYGAEACGAEVAPLVEQLHSGSGQTADDYRPTLRLVPRHLMHATDLYDTVERCGIAAQRQNSIQLLAICARRLAQCGIGPARVIRDSAIGMHGAVVQEVATHVAADLVITGDYETGQGRPASTAQAPCPVLIVPASSEVVHDT